MNGTNDPELLAKMPSIRKIQERIAELERELKTKDNEIQTLAESRDQTLNQLHEREAEIDEFERIKAELERQTLITESIQQDNTLLIAKVATLELENERNLSHIQQSHSEQTLLIQQMQDIKRQLELLQSEQENELNASKDLLSSSSSSLQDQQQDQQQHSLLHSSGDSSFSVDPSLLDTEISPSDQPASESNQSLSPLSSSVHQDSPSSVTDLIPILIQQFSQHQTKVCPLSFSSFRDRNKLLIVECVENENENEHNRFLRWILFLRLSALVLRLLSEPSRLITRNSNFLVSNQSLFRSLFCSFLFSPLHCVLGLLFF